NLIMGREVVKELIQNDFNSKNLKAELKKILDEKNRKRIFEDYFLLEQKLGGSGASKNTAELIYKKISE
ncbi:MAG: lipid-A-disaccharide synthase, partial [Christiangramia sp.]|nr:lipid-A-disaccharide synthase [Christiangramia sp.]